jgi:hypothetical protein
LLSYFSHVTYSFTTSILNYLGEILLIMIEESSIFINNKLLNNTMIKFLKINNASYFWSLCIFSGIFMFLSKQFLYTDQLYYYTISDNFKTIEDLSVNCCSLLRIVGMKNVPNWLIFAYNSINLFELIYITLLIFFVKSCFHTTLVKSIVFVLSTYFIGNYLYVVGLTFLYLNFS